MRKLNVEAIMAQYTSKRTDIHLLFLLDLSYNVPLDFFQQTVIVVSCVAGTRFDGVADVYVADAATTMMLILYAEEDV